MDFNWLGEYIIPFFLKSVKVVFFYHHPSPSHLSKCKGKSPNVQNYTVQYTI